ncbi:MAG: right-handed parallel beta-helix repeat-containing protein [Clostridia bacterium]|nr:right-handed parallel beta-helix repeat-containing protein [Clostridia bacterium]
MKRTLALAITLALLAVLCCAAASADGITTWSELQIALSAGGTVTLTQDLTAGPGDGMLQVSGTVTLDLNGHTLDRNRTAADADGHVIIVNASGSLTIRDSGDGGTITGGYANNGGGINNKGTLTIEGGTISGNYVNLADNSYHGGGGIVSYGTATLAHCTVSSNTAKGSGGGIWSKGNLSLSECSVSENTSTSGMGGGICANGGTVTMAGSDIYNNSAQDGGGVYINAGASVTAAGDTYIEANTATVTDGGGVTVNGTLAASGNLRVTGNTANRAGGECTGTVAITGGTVRLQLKRASFDLSSDDRYCYIGHGEEGDEDGTLTLGDLYAVQYTGTAMPESVTGRVEACRSFDARVLIIAPCEHSARTYTSTADNHTAKCFSCKYSVTEDHVCSDGDVCTLCGYEGVLRKVRFVKGHEGAQGAMETVSAQANSQYLLPACAFTAPEGMRFREWSVKIGDAEAVLKAAGEAITLSADTVLTAVWELVYTVTFSANGGSGTMEAIQVLPGTAWTLPVCAFDPPAETMEFLQWLVAVGSGSVTLKNAGETVQVTADTSVTAMWQTVTFGAPDFVLPGSLSAIEAEAFGKGDKRALSTLEPRLVVVISAVFHNQSWLSS